MNQDGTVSSGGGSSISVKQGKIQLRSAIDSLKFEKFEVKVVLATLELPCAVLTFV